MTRPRATVTRASGKAGFARKAKAIARKSLARALNRAGRASRTEVGRGMARETGLRVRDVRAAVTFRPARVRRLEIETEARGRPLNLIRFRARQTKQGVRAKAYGKTRLFRGMWIGNDGRTVFVRTRRGGRSVRGAYGPGIANTFLDRVRTRIYRKRLELRVRKEFEASFEFLMGRALKG